MVFNISYYGAMIPPLIVGGAWSVWLIMVAGDKESFKGLTDDHNVYVSPKNLRADGGGSGSGSGGGGSEMKSLLDVMKTNDDDRYGSI